MSQQYRRIGVADARRACDGMSGFRKCVFLGEYLDRLTGERRFTEHKRPGARIKAALVEDNVDASDFGSLTVDTLSRYRHERCTWNP